VWTEPGWRVAHDFNSSLAGWLAVVPTRHVEALDKLTPIEAGTLGRLLRDASVALKTVTGCAKTYVMLFAEAEGFAHLHLHVVPRSDDLPEKYRGPAVLEYLKGPPLGDLQRDDLALRLRTAWPPSDDGRTT
jgi:diadenosine tetraphosphate (Ap4A) HIT family hydrolase